MSEDITGDIMRYPYNQYLKQRLEFVLLRDDELQAKIMRIVEGWMVPEKANWLKSVQEAIEKKQPEPAEPEHYWVTISQGQFITQLYKFDSAKVKNKKNTISRGTLRKAIEALLEDGYLLIRPQPNNEFGAPQYTLNTKLIEGDMATKLPKKPWSYLAGGVTNFETPPPSNFETGDTQKLELPLTNFETGELQKLKVLLDNLLHTRLDTEITEDTSDDVAYAPHHGTPTSFSFEPSTTKEHTNGNSNLPGNNHISTDNVRDSAVQSQLAPLADQIRATANERESTPSGVGTYQAGDTHGQPTDTMTSQARDNDGREAPVPLQAKSGTDLPASSPEPLTAFTDASQNEVTSARNQRRIASDTRQPTDEKRENATEGSGVPTEQSTPPESGAKGKGKKPEDETLKARVERVFAYFDKLKQETTGNPRERYARTKAATKEIKDTLLPCGPTELKLRKVYLKLWNTPPSRDGFHWKDHMTIKAVCGQYESMTLAFDAEENAEAEKKRTKQMLESIVSQPTIIAQAEDDYVFDLERVRGNRGRRSAS